MTALGIARFDLNTTALRGFCFLRVIPIDCTKFCCILEPSTTGENMKHKPMATYNRKGYDKGDLLVIVVCFALFIAIAVMHFAGWLPGDV
jgi:hypothetical protein